MRYSVEFLLGASRELDLAFEWYESQRTGLGTELLRAVAAARDVLTRDPLRFPETRKSFRWVKLRRFPYALHYEIDGEAVRVLACLHFHQNPDRWPGV